MSGVFLSNVDDYLAPSQACVNPLFSTDKKKDDEKKSGVVGTLSNGNHANDDPNSFDTAAASENPAIVPRKRVRRRLPAAITASSDWTPRVPKDPVQASIADCLACSGCVTTAETVLLETQHSVVALKELIAKKENARPKIVATISPAAWADLHRQLSREFNCSPSLSLSAQQRWTTLLWRALKISSVLDGNIPLAWSLEEAALEFCRAYKRKQTTNDPDAMAVDVPQDELWQQQLIPSFAESRSQSQYYVNGETKTVYHDGGAQQAGSLPLLSGSCPAVVCLVEKSTHKAVPHLATTKSPLALAGEFWKRQHFDKHTSLPRQEYYHVAIMPCHDKKLEASRKDFEDESGKDVDIVITTQECMRLIQELLDVSIDDIVKCFRELPLATLSDCTSFTKAAEPVLIADSNSHCITTLTTEDAEISSNAAFTLGSGGYASFIFAYAAKRLFGVQLDAHELPWEPVGPDQAGRVSARVAASTQRRRDYYHVALYRSQDGNFTTNANLSSDSKPILHFAIAYGMQTLQRVLKPYTSEHLQSGIGYDYVEAMACPSGCVNGGGQIRTSARETPTETRLRVGTTQTLLPVPQMNESSGRTQLGAGSSLHTRYHIVPPLQHSLGAAAGVPVKDTQW